jgi:hypothetical protein
MLGEFPAVAQTRILPGEKAVHRLVEQIRGGYKVLDANGQSLAYVYGRETKAAE